MNRYFDLTKIPRDKHVPEAIQNTTETAYDFAEAWEISNKGLPSYTWLNLANALFDEFKVPNEISKANESFLSIQMRGLNIQSYNDEFTKLLLAADGTISDDTLQFYYLRGLDSRIRVSVENSRNNLDAATRAKYTLAEMRLKAVESTTPYLPRHNDTTSYSPTPYTGKNRSWKGNPNPKGGAYRFRNLPVRPPSVPKGGGKGKLGSKDGKGASPKGGKPSTSNAHVQCYNCGEMGHYAHQCTQSRPTNPSRTFNSIQTYGATEIYADGGLYEWVEDEPQSNVYMRYSDIPMRWGIEPHPWDSWSPYPPDSSSSDYATPTEDSQTLNEQPTPESSEQTPVLPNDLQMQNRPRSGLQQ